LAGQRGSTAQRDRFIWGACSGDFRHLRSEYAIRCGIRGEVRPDDKISRDLDMPGDTGFGRTTDETDLKTIRALIGDHCRLNQRVGFPIAEQANECHRSIGRWWMVGLIEGIDAVTACTGA